MKTEWNTDRQCDKRGQLMRAAFVEYDSIAFADLSRRIDGIIYGQFGRIESEGERALQALVMTAYDNGLYTAPRTAEERAALLELGEGA